MHGAEPAESRNSTRRRAERPPAPVVADVGAPVWAPLETTIGADLCGWFVWLYAADDPGGVIHAYRHRSTRHCLHLRGDGVAFRLTHDERFVMMPLRTAVALAFRGWERGGPSGVDIVRLRTFFWSYRGAIRP